MTFFLSIYKMKLLELFSGTKSVSKSVGDKYDEIISLDVLDKNNPTVVSDILKWDYKIYPREYFHTIWASPPCTEYSKAKTTGIRNIELANSIVKKTLEIIDYFKPIKWFMENPQTGLLKSQSFMKDIPFYDVDYCQYGKDYRKRTRIWTNIKGFDPKICIKSKCSKVVDGKHVASCGNGYSKYTNRQIKQNEKYSIPEQLIKDLFYDAL